MTSLSSLPAEIVHSILEEVSHQALLNLRATSKRFHSFTTPLVFKKLYFDTGAAEHSKYADFPSNTIASHVRAVIVGKFSKISQERQEHDDYDASLTSVLGSFQNLESLTWHCRSSVSLTTFPTLPLRDQFRFNPTATVKAKEGELREFTHAFASLPTLREVRLWVDTTITPVPVPEISSFANLRSLVVKYRSPGASEFFKNELAPALRSSPHLNEFSLACHPSSPLPESLIPDLFPSRSNIKNLRLYSVPFSSDVDVGQIFPALQNLAIYFDPSNGFGPSPIAWDQIWNSLREAGVWVRELSTSGSGIVAQTALIQYLRSHPGGLRKLVLDAPTSSWFREEEDLQNAELEENARLFWGEVLPKQQDTLQELEVLSQYEGGWCYGPAASASLVLCRNLKRLRLNLCTVDPGWATQKVFQLSRMGNERWGNPESCAVLLLKDLVDSGLLQVSRNTGISVVIRIAQRRPFHATNPESINFIGGPNPKIKELIKKFQPGLSLNQLPIFPYRSETFKWLHDLERNVWFSLKQGCVYI